MRAAQGAVVRKPVSGPSVTTSSDHVTPLLNGSRAQRNFVRENGPFALVLVLACTVALSSTVGLGVGNSWFDEQRVLCLIALAIASVALIFSRPPDNLMVLAVLAALTLGLLSALVAIRPLAAMADWAVYCTMAMLIIWARQSSARLFEMCTALVVAIVATAYTTGVVANYVSSLLLGIPVGAETLLVGFSNPRFPAQLQALTIPLIPLALRVAPAGFWRSALLGVAVLWWMCLVGSGSRTAWIALGAVALMIAFYGRVGLTWVRVQLALMACGLALWGLFFFALPSLLSLSTALESGRFSNFASMGSRWTLWRLSVEAAIANPWLGIGPMHFAYVDNGEGAHPHNFWLQLAAEWGLPATLLIGAVTIVFCVRLLRAVKTQQDERSKLVGVTIVAAVAAWGIGTLADGYMVVPTSQLMSTVVLMLAVMWLRQVQPVVESKPVLRASGRLMQLMGAGALVILVYLPFTPFGQPTSREMAWRSEKPGAFMWPRFWQQGWIGPDQDPTAR
jgi:putative inorganic carbon (hco3(-)) transporter